MRVEELTGRVLVETNVVIYATLAGDPRHPRAQEVLALRHRAGLELFVPVQNLAEVYPNLTGSKNQPPYGSDLARDKIRSLFRLRKLTTLPLTREGVHHALDLCVAGGVTRQNYFDRQLAALILREGIPTIVTENDKNFSGIAGITPLYPFTCHAMPCPTTAHPHSKNRSSKSGAVPKLLTASP